MVHFDEVPPAGRILAVRINIGHRWKLQAKVVANDFLGVKVQETFSLDKTAFFV